MTRIGDAVHYEVGNVVIKTHEENVSEGTGKPTIYDGVMYPSTAAAKRAKNTKC